MSDYLSAEIAATCAALGYWDEKTYHVEKDCAETLRDLIKYLRRDGENHTIRRYLGRTKLVQSDLVKILISHPDRDDLFEVNLRLLVNLTSPALLLYNEELPADQSKRNDYLQIVAHLQEYKAVLGDEQFWTVLCTKLGMILNIPNDERSEDRGLVIERILILARNVLQVPADIESERRADSEGTIHDQVLFALHTSGMVDMFLFIASNKDEQQYQMHVLEIVSLMLREQSASKLATAGLERNTAEKEQDEADLIAVRQKESLQKIERARKYAGSRHSRFGGTFVVRNMKAIGDNELICHKPFHELEDLEFSQRKARVKRPRDKLGIQGENPERRSALSVRLFLKEFCVEFLNGAYNPVMRYARSCITGGNRAQANDESYYLWALRYFMEFNRQYKFEVKFVSETMSKEVFHLVQRQLEHYYEMMITDKKKIPFWSRRLHLALKAHKELVYTLTAMDKSADKTVRGYSDMIKRNVFYVPEYRETLLNQLLCYNELTMSRNYLTDLIEAVHIFLKMLETFCSSGRAMIVQKKKARRQRRAGKRPENKKGEAPQPLSLDQRWDEASSQLAVVMQSATIPEISPFDATLDTPVDEQKADAMKRIQKFLRGNQFEEAIGLLRAAREVWPENDSFGHANMSQEEEFIALRDIYFADLGLGNEEVTIFGGQNIGAASNNGDFRNEDHLESEEEDEEEAAERAPEETDFKFTDFLHRFVNVKVVKACTLLLKQFDKNTVLVNHYAVKLMHRIAMQCKMPAMIFQAGIFRIFQRILDSKNPNHVELAKFAIFIFKNFAEVATKNPKAYMELLFWKTTREATEMVEGYDADRENNKSLPNTWTEAEEDQLRALFMEHQTNNYDTDLVDWILMKLNDNNRTKRKITAKLKEMCLIANSKSVRNEVRKRLPQEWGEDEIAQLSEIWGIVKDDNDPVDMIYTELRIKRPKIKIKEKLLELGLAKDRKELRKKRSGKKSSGISEGENRSDSDSGSERDSDNRSSSIAATLKTKPIKPKKRSIVRRSKKLPSIVYTNAQLSGLLKDIISNSESRDALEWVKESLEEALEDLDEESSEGIPLVPVTDFANAAMDSPSFQRFLRAMGVEPPANEQETYWRIPSNMLSSTMRKRAELIADGLDGKFVEEEAPRSLASDRELDADEQSDDDATDVFENVKKFFIRKSVDPEAAGGSRSNFSEIAKKGTDSEPEEQEIQEVVSVDRDAAAVVSGASKTNTRRIKPPTVDSDSEVEIDTWNTSASDENKRERSDNSDHEIPATKKRRLLDSDDEGEGMAEVARQRQKAITDDED